MSPHIQPTHIQREEEFDDLYANINLESAKGIIISSEDFDDTSDFFDASSIDDSSDTASISTLESITSSGTNESEVSQLPTYVKVSLPICNVSQGAENILHTYLNS